MSWRRALGRASRTGGALADRPWRWVIVGAGPFKARPGTGDRGLTGSARTSCSPDKAIDADLHAWYEAATLFVHPTRYEGSSIVTLEAMAHRRAVVATRAGGLPDKVRPGVNGWLVPPDDAGELANALEDALSDPARLLAMGLRSRAIVEREFAWSVLVTSYLDVYRELLARAAHTSTT